MLSTVDAGGLLSNKLFANGGGCVTCAVARMSGNVIHPLLCTGAGLTLKNRLK
jgi:hypothetical protein